ncbi:MAG: DEAD/DEAH box helicase, partial [Nanoarchaeota archaeon]
MEKFRKLGIIEPVLQAINEEGFLEPTEIQLKSIPHAVSGKDVIAGAATGSGKTLAFAAGIIQSAERGKGIQALVLAPTRELAVQITLEMKKFSKHKPLNVVDIYGGVGITPQIERLRRADVVVGTPGRILDHMERRTINLTLVKVLVLDEADRMLDMGFIDDVKKIMGHCPLQKQTLLFSATIGKEIHSIAEKFMHNAIKVSAESHVDPRKLKQVYYNVQENQKMSLLVHLLKHYHEGLIMIFCNSRHTTDFVAGGLTNAGLPAYAIHGGLSQDKRTQVIMHFHAHKVKILIATDVAARGLDIKGVSHVYNYDIPKESKQYVHRIGRTARAGEAGKAVNLLSERDHDNFSKVLRDNDVTVEKMDLPEFEKLRFAHRSNDRGRRFGRDSNRPSRPAQRFGGPRGG